METEHLEPRTADQDRHTANLQQVRAAGRHALTKPLTQAEMAVMCWFVLNASRYGTNEIAANFADITKQLGYSDAAAGKAIAQLVKHGVLERVSNPLSPLPGRHGLSPTFRVVAPAEYIDAIPPAGDRWELVSDIRPTYERIMRGLGALRNSPANPGGLAGAWRVLLTAIGESLTWGRVSFSGNDTALELGKNGYLTRRALAHVGVVVETGSGRRDTEYSFGQICSDVDPDPLESPPLYELALSVYSSNPDEASSADAEVVDMHAGEEWPATTDEIADAVAATYSVPVTRPIREQASRLSKKGVTLEEMHRYLRWKREEYEPKCGFGVGWVTERLTEIVAQHQAVVSHELHDGFRTAPPPSPLTRAEAEAEWLMLHTETVAEHMNADQLAELYSYVLDNTAPGDTTRHALSNATADHPWDPLDNPAVLADVAAAHGHRTGIDRDGWITTRLELG
jgi:hypothetical protein